MLFNTESYILISCIFLALIGIILLQLIKRQNNAHEKLKENIIKTQSIISKAKSISNSKESPEQKLNSLNTLIKEFLKEKFSIDPILTYSETAEKRKSKNLAELCKTMSRLYYSGNKIEEKDIKEIYLLMSSLESPNKRVLTLGQDPRPNGRNIPVPRAQGITINENQEIEDKRIDVKKNKDFQKAIGEISEYRKSIKEILKHISGKEQKNFHEISEKIRNINNSFSSTFSRVYNSMDKKKKKEMDNIIKKWMSEKSSIKKSENKIHKFIKETELFEKYLIKLSIFLAKSSSAA